MICSAVDLGLIDYRSALDIQRGFHSAVKEGRGISTLILAEHFSCVTIGRATGLEEKAAAEKECAYGNMEAYEVRRGGALTYHAPGQLISYPVFDLNILGRDIHKYLRNLEEVIIRLLESYKISGEREKGYTGVWVGGKKICSIGVAVSGWVTYHGLALNVADAMRALAYIHPCGLSVDSYASIKELAGFIPDMAQIRERLLSAFREVFGLEYAEHNAASRVA